MRIICPLDNKWCLHACTVEEIKRDDGGTVQVLGCHNAPPDYAERADIIIDDSEPN